MGRLRDLACRSAYSERVSALSRGLRLKLFDQGTRTRRAVRHIAETTSGCHRSHLPGNGERQVPIREAAEQAKDDRYRRWAETKKHMQSAGNPPSSRLLDARIDELTTEFPEYSIAELAQVEIDADARRNWNAEAYPPYVGPGYTEPPLNWRGPWSEHEKDHYWDRELEAGA